MKGAGHTLTVRPGMPRVLDMASGLPGPLSEKVIGVLRAVEERKAAVAASRLKVTEILAKGKKAGKREKDLLVELDRYLQNADEMTSDVRQIDSLRAQVEALGPGASQSEVALSLIHI